MTEGTENLWWYVDESGEEWGPFDDEERADIDATSTEHAGNHRWELIR